MDPESRTVFLCRLNIQIEPVEYRTESLQVLPKTTSDISAQLLIFAYTFLRYGYTSDGTTVTTTVVTVFAYTILTTDENHVFGSHFRYG